jgi:exodeoxyribonuclease V alpha subunit
MYLRGRIERVLHTSGTFHILSFRVEDYEGVSAPNETKLTGHFFGVSQLAYNIALEVEGNWTKHPKYGRQFRVKSWRPWAKYKHDVERFLANCVDVFTDPAWLRKVVDRFGIQTYDALADDRVLELATNDNDRIELLGIREKWQTVRAIATLADFLQEYELGASLVAAVFHRFGYESVEILSKNPYRLVEIDGVSFHRADALAVSRGIGPGDPKRIAGGVLWVLREQVRQQGHLFLRRGDVAPLLADLAAAAMVAPFDVPDLPKAVDVALEELEKNDAVLIDPGVGVYVPDMFRYERDSARMLSQFLTPSELGIDLHHFLGAYERTSNITLSDMQREAMVQLIANRVLVVTGAPGTGKTTLIRTFVHLFRSLGIPHMLMAPTGIAAKRLAGVTETQAQTIHRALKYDGFQWGHNSFDRLETGAAIVDELSMVDQELFYRLLDALDPKTMLVLVGDDAQLPSVGPGNVLRELIACKALRTIRLEHVFRQAETSDIVLAAHRIRRGSSPLGLPPKDDTEFKFVKVLSEEQIADLIVKMAVKLKGRNANFQVLSPKYDGTVGVDNLNSLLRDQLNPDHGQPTWELPSVKLRVGDRVMIVKNNYRLNVYNGDIGKLVSISKDSLTLRVHGVGKTPDASVEIPKDQAAVMLKLAYAVTVHKSQGEEFETVILPLVKAHGRMLQRNLFYTAITRARKKVWLLGDPEAVLKAVANDKVIQRNTILRELVVPHVVLH